MTLRAKHPLVYYLESNKRRLNYRNVRRHAEERVCAREAREKRQADLRAQSQERERRERRMAAETLVVRQRTLAECLKRRRVVYLRLIVMRRRVEVCLKMMREEAALELYMLRIVYTLMSSTHLGNCSACNCCCHVCCRCCYCCCHSDYTPAFRLLRLWLLLHLRCLPRMCCRLLLVLCLLSLLLPPLLLLVQVGYNGLERRRGKTRKSDVDTG
jgi:hypothetical protein